VQFDNEDIRKVQRLGSKAEAHIRPILIQLGSRHMKNLIMESLYKIKSMDRVRTMPVLGYLVLANT